MTISMFDGLEKPLEDLYKNVPSLPDNWRKWIAKYAWVFTLIGAVLLTFVALGLLAALGIFSVITVAAGAAGYTLFLWLAFAMLIVTVVLTYMAISPLKEMKKEGWKLLFYIQIFYLIFDAFDWLSSPSRIGELIWALIAAFIGFYVLFQIRKHFN